MRWRWVFAILAVLSCFSGVPLAVAKDKSFIEIFEKIGLGCQLTSFRGLDCSIDSAPRPTISFVQSVASDVVFLSTNAYSCRSVLDGRFST